MAPGRSRSAVRARQVADDDEELWGVDRGDLEDTEEEGAGTPRWVNVPGARVNGAPQLHGVPPAAMQARPRRPRGACAAVARQRSRAPWVRGLGVVSWVMAEAAPAVGCGCARWQSDGSWSVARMRGRCSLSRRNADMAGGADDDDE
jgi:hypothetical protein